jgi:myo-inositol 2-dehydrogenase/D-chiro-inositol 1-dehydrogenase
MQLRFGVIGAGRIGTLHAHNLSTRIPHTRVTWIADSRRECAEAAAAMVMARTGSAPSVSTDFRDVVGSPDVDAVLIATSTDTHIPIIDGAATAGKHVFCEKPIDHDIERIRTVLARVQQAQVCFQVGFNRRFDPDFRDVIQQVGTGHAGVPHLVRITSRDPQPPSIEYVKRSGGLFLDMTIHDLDMARALVHEEIVEVHAMGSTMVDPAIAAVGDIDTALVVLRYASGALCCIDNSRKASYGYDQRVEVFGSGGCIVAQNRTPTRVEVWDEMGQHRDRPLEFFLERYRESYVAELQEFAGSIRQRRAPQVDGADGLQAVILAQAAQKSWQTGRPVTLGRRGSREDAA